MRPSLAALVPALLACPAALASWPFLPGVNLAIADRPGDQAVLKMAAASDGGCWFGWFDNSGGSYAVRVQKVDFFGDETFAHNGLLVSTNPQNTSLIDWDLNSDGAGGCVAAFTDIRAGGDLDVYAYRIGANGALLWGANGVTISDNTNFDADPRIARLSTGDFAVVYSRLVQSGGAAPGLVLQRLDAAGNKQLGADGVVIAGDGTEAPGFVEITPAESGSFIAVWVRDTRTFSSPRQVFCQKFSAGGAGLWNGGSPIVLSTNLVPIAHRPRLVPDGSGGAVFAWHTTALLAFAQRVSAAGTVQWPANGLQVITTAGNLTLDPALTYEPITGETTIFVRETNSTQSQTGLFFQRVNASGSRFDADGVAIVPLGAAAVSAPLASRTLSQHAMLVYSTTAFGTNDTTVWGSRIQANGTPLWPGQRRQLSPSAGSRFRLRLAPTANGEVRVGWEGDTRIDAAGDVYAQNLTPGGTLGACPGDSNNDLFIDFNDLNIVLGSFGQTGSLLPGDVNGDGEVTFADLNIVLGGFGTSCFFP